MLTKLIRTRAAKDSEPLTQMVVECCSDVASLSDHLTSLFIEEVSYSFKDLEIYLSHGQLILINQEFKKLE